MNEILFFKVFRNKYLNFKIFEYLNSNEIYNNNNKITATTTTQRKIIITNEQFSEERIIKFKYIYNFNWMIKNKQFQLLKCKLLNNDYIEFNLIDNDDNETWKSLFSISNNQESINFEEIIQLLYKRFENKIKKINKEIMVINLLNHSNSIKNINLILKSFQISTSLESIISDTIENNDQPTFKRYLTCSLKNKIIKIELLELFSEILIKLQKQQSNFKISIENLLLINSSIIQNQLLDLDLVEKESPTYYKTEIETHIGNILNSNKKSNKEIIEIIKICIKLKIKQQQEGQPQQVIQNDNNTLKELFKQFIIISGKNELKLPRCNYGLYLSKFDDVIQEVMDNDYQIMNTVWYCLYTLSFNVLKYLNLEMINEYVERNYLVFSYNTSSNLESLINFLKLYLSILSQDSEKVKISTHLERITNHIILNIMFRIDNSELYNSILNQVIPLKYKSEVPSKFNLIQTQFKKNNKEFIIIKDIETIDWINECYETVFKNCFNEEFSIFLNRFLFESIELSNYAKIKLKYLSLDSIYSYQFAKAIKECDLKSLISFTDGVYIDKLLNVLKIIPHFKNSTFEEYNELFNYFIKKFPVFQDKLFIEYIVENGYYYNDDDQNQNQNQDSFFDLSKIKIKELKNYNIIKFYEFKSIKLERFITENLTFNESFEFQKINIFDKELIKSYEYYMELIKIYIIKFNKCREEKEEISKIYIGILNRILQLFLINCKESTCVQSIYQLFIENSIIQNIDENLIFIELLKSRFPILNSFGDCFTDNLKSKLTSYEIVMNISYGEILPYLVSIDFDNVIKKSVYYLYNYNYLLNRNLILFLKSNRLDLFFNQLNSITRITELESCLIKFICKSFDIDSLNSFFKLTKSYSYTNTNSVYYYIMATQFLKLNRIDLFDHLFNYLKFNDRKNIKFNRSDYSNNQLLQIFNSLISIHKCVITFTINPIN